MTTINQGNLPVKKQITEKLVKYWPIAS